MSWTPISNTVPQYYDSNAPATDFYIKFYQAGTTTPIVMAVDFTGSPTLAKCKINSDGYPVNGSDAPFIPHIDQTYKIVLYRNAADADANDTGSAVFVIDNLEPVETFSSGQIVRFTSWSSTETYQVDDLVKGSNGSIYRCVQVTTNNDPITDDGTYWVLSTLQDGVRSVATIAAMKALNALADGEVINLMGHTTLGDAPGRLVRYDKSSTASADNVTVFTPDTAPGRFIWTPSKGIDVRYFGVVVDDASVDNSATLTTALEYSGTNGVPIHFPKGDIRIVTPVTINNKWIGIEGVKGSLFIAGFGTRIYLDSASYGASNHVLKVFADTSNIRDLYINNIWLDANGKGGRSLVLQSNLVSSGNMTLVVGTLPD
jgi:hypothetical protein